MLIMSLVSGCFDGIRNGNVVNSFSGTLCAYSATAMSILQHLEIDGIVLQMMNAW